MEYPTTRSLWTAVLLAGALTLSGTPETDASDPSHQELDVRVCSGATLGPRLVQEAEGFSVRFSGREGSRSQVFDRNARPLGPPREAPPAPSPPVRRAELSDGGTVRIEEHWGIDGDGWGLMAEVVEADGARRAFRINRWAEGDQMEPAVAALDENAFIVVWQSDGQDGDGWGIIARRFDSDGKAGPEVRLNANTVGNQIEPAVLALDGAVVVAWRSRDPDGLFLRRLGDLIFADNFESGDFKAWSQVVGAPLVAGFVATPPQGYAPSTITFDGASSSDPDGAVIAWEWDFGDGTSGSGVEVEHLYSEPGLYTVTLTVTGADGATTTATGSLAVLPPIEALAAAAALSLRNDVLPELALGRASTPTVSLRNDVLPELALGRVSAPIVSLRNDVAPGPAFGRADSPIVSVRNDGQP